jgi:hypothetical protein
MYYLSSWLATDVRLYFKKHDRISKPMLFYPKVFVLVSMLEYLLTTYLLCLVVLFSIET